jgi:histone-lysine N-methyltransferase SETMAR
MGIDLLAHCEVQFAHPGHLKDITPKLKPLCCALQTVRHVLPSTQTSIIFSIDATQVGNVARFFNHRCGGGTLEPVLVRTAGSMVPHIAMFARDHIERGDELTFSYGAGAPAAAQPGRAWRRCCCGADVCAGYLPRDA